MKTLFKLLIVGLIAKFVMDRVRARRAEQATAPAALPPA
jgi:hypothetical protein